MDFAAKDCLHQIRLKSSLLKLHYYMQLISSSSINAFEPLVIFCKFLRRKYLSRHEVFFSFCYSLKCDYYHHQLLFQQYLHQSGCITVASLDRHLYACPCFLSRTALYLLWPVRMWADGGCPLTPLAYIGSRVAWLWRKGGVTKQPLHHVHLLKSVPDILPCGFHCIQSIVMLGKKEEELVLMHYAWV